MIKIFTGNDRVAAKKAIEKFLGSRYEIIDATNLDLGDLPNVFLGNSLFDEKRRILLRDFSENKVAFEKLPDYLNSPHQIALFETKLDKRSVAYKTIKGKVDIQEFTLPQNQDFRLVFDIYRTAKKDGKKAIKLLEKIKINEDPIQFAGLLNSQAINDYASKQGTEERRTLKELSKLDIDLKSSKLSSWSLIESFLLRLSSWWS